ncbi:MAG: BON domain-containing protein [Actinobacteria bacterium]|nr:BON domain-containing protein [Actinomycetota bacterium]
MLRLLRYASLGAALTYFFDPQNGRRRRALAMDRIPAFLRGKARHAERLGRTAQSQAYGATQKLKHRQEEDKPQPDDVTLARKVETEIFRDAEVPKGQINVNAENGVVVLRGEVEQPELIRDLEKKTRNVQGVREVENLLHAPGTPAPAKS